MGGKETGWIVAAVVTVAAFIGLHSFAGRGHEIRRERDAYRDSLAVSRVREAVAIAVADSAKVNADSANARAERLERKGSPTVILPGIVKTTQHAMVDEIHDGLMNEPK